MPWSPTPNTNPDHDEVTGQPDFASVQESFSRAVRERAWDKVLVAALDGADLQDKRPTGSGCSALHAAIRDNRLDLTGTLLRLGADPDYVNPEENPHKAPLHV